MKKFLFIFLSFFILSGCTHAVVDDHPCYDGVRFRVIYQESAFTGGSRVLLDTVTGKTYFFHKCGYGAGLCPLNND